MADLNIVLAIESAVGGGSIAISKGNELIDIWRGKGGVSRAEDLLLNIDLLLNQNDITKELLTKIVVSVGPGSFTGIRIGLATAMGLSTALNIELLKYSILYAMVTASPDEENIITAIPMGRSFVCQQKFRKNAKEIVALTEPVSITETEFDSEMLTVNNLVTADTHDNCMAVCLIQAVNDFRVERASEPLFISKSVT